MAGRVSGSRSGQAVAGALDDHELAPGPAGGVLGRLQGHGEVAGAVDGDHRDAAPGRGAASIHRLPRLRRIDTAGPSSRQGRATWPTRVGTNSRPSFIACSGFLSTGGVVDRVEGEQHDHAGHGRREQAADVDQAVPGVADDGVDEHHADGPLGLGGAQLGDDPAAHGVAGEERPVRCRARRAPGRAGPAYWRKLAPPEGRPWVLPWLAVSMAMTLKPIDTRRDSVWA